MLPEKITNLDLKYLEKRLITGKQWSPETAKEAVRRYKNFLNLLLKYPDENLAPTPDIDEVWHNHILFTREYFRDCREIFGEYLHHAPFDHVEGEVNKEMQDLRSSTADLYFREFNEPYFLELDVGSFW